MPLYRIFALIILAAAGAGAWMQSQATEAHRAEIDSIALIAPEQARPIPDGANPGSARMAFSKEIGLTLLWEIPADRQLILKSIGDSDDQLVASDVQRFLQDNGYDVIRVIAKTGSSRSLHRIEFSVDAYDNVLTIAPSARPVSG